MTEITLISNQHKAIELGLNPKQRYFSELFASYDEFFGNGTKSYMKAYKVSYETAMVRASGLLRNVKILEYINYLLELRGLNDVFVDKQLELLITQNADYRSKLGGIVEYNKLKKRIGASVINPTQINVFISEAIAKKNGIEQTTKKTEVA